MKSDIISILQNAVAQASASLYDVSTRPEDIQITVTPSGFAGDYSIRVFNIAKAANKDPVTVALEISQSIQSNPEVTRVVKSVDPVKAFINTERQDTYWHDFLQTVNTDTTFGRQPRNGRKVMVEYSSPNTNKPLHLGHVRNCLLGWSCSRILDAVGYDVVRTQIVNDRGVAICKSMLAWQKFGEGKTPDSEGTKGDHFVGDYYVLFENKTRAEYETWQQTAAAQAFYAEKHKPDQTEKDFFKDYKNKWFNEHSQLGAEVREMLLKWEASDPATVALWRQMNGWVYAGFDETYGKLGVAFDKLYYESDTYLLGKDIVEDGLKKGVFFRKEDGSVWVDLTDAGYDQKVVLRADGTSVYITQDIGTARMRYHDFGCEKMVYVVADEQNYHFVVLFEVLKRLGEPYAEGLHHLSYGLVELPTGRMKTREGTVVDADDLMDEVISLAWENARGRDSELTDMDPGGRSEDIRKIGMGALKFYMTKVNPRKKMIFNPEESVDLQGQTGPYIQYSYVRINGLMQRVEKENVDLSPAQHYTGFQQEEKELLKALHEYPEVVLAAAREYDPSHLANFCYNLAKSYHRLWHEHSVFNAESAEAKAFRLQLSRAVGSVLQSGMHLLGIEMPDRM